MFRVSNRNTRKRCLLISRITLKTSERRHVTISYLPEVTVQNHIWTVFPRMYTNFQSKVCFQFCFQVRRTVISIIVNLCHFVRFMKIQNVFLFLKKNSPKNRQIFQLFTLYSKSRHFIITKLDILSFCNKLHLKMDF